MSLSIRQRLDPISPLLDLSTIVFNHVFSYAGRGDLASFALASRKCHAIVEDVLLFSHWFRLISPTTYLPKGPVDLPSLIGRINQSHLDDINVRGFFQELAKEFANLGATLPDGMLPLMTVDLLVLQQRAEMVAQERALLAIGSRIAVRFHRDKAQVQKADHVSNWFNDPKNVKRVKSSLELYGLGLKVLPSEIAQCTQLTSLNLSYNQLSTLPVALGALTELELLFLENNQFRTLPDTIGSFKKLKRLFVNNNKFCLLPGTIGSFPQLEWLYIRNNQLGSLPVRNWIFTTVENS